MSATPTPEQVAAELEARSFEIEGANGGTKKQPLCGDRCRFMEPNSCGCSAAGHDLRAAAALIRTLAAREARLREALEEAKNCPHWGCMTCLPKISAALGDAP